MVFKHGSTFVRMRNSFANFAATGSDIANSDPEVQAARMHEKAGPYWLGFDIVTALFGDPAKGALGSTSMGPGSGKIRTSLGDIEHELLATDDSVRGFNGSVQLHLNFKK